MDALKEWLEGQRRSLEALSYSKVVASLVTDNYLQSPEGMLQIGAAILLDKPIVLMVIEGVKVPPKLAQIADRIVMIKKDEMGLASDELAAFVQSLD